MIPSKGRGAWLVKWIDMKAELVLLLYLLIAPTGHQKIQKFRLIRSKNTFALTKIHIVLYMLTLLYFWWYESHDKTVATYNLVHIFQLYHSFTRNFNKNFISHRVKRSLSLCIVFWLIQTVNILGFPWLVTSSLKSNAFLFGAKMALSDWMRRTNEKWARVGDIL